MLLWFFFSRHIILCNFLREKECCVLLDVVCVNMWFSLVHMVRLLYNAWCVSCWSENSNCAALVVVKDYL